MSVCMLICRGIQNQSSMNNITCGIYMWKRWLADLSPTWWSFRCSRQVFETEAIPASHNLWLIASIWEYMVHCIGLVNISDKWCHDIKATSSSFSIGRRAGTVKYETQMGWKKERDTIGPNRKRPMHSDCRVMLRACVSSHRFVSTWPRAFTCTMLKLIVDRNSSA